jgi:hypothetical protein
VGDCVFAADSCHSKLDERKEHVLVLLLTEIFGTARFRAHGTVITGAGARVGALDRHHNTRGYLDGPHSIQVHLLSACDM